MKKDWPFVTSDEAVAGTTPSGVTYLAARAITMEQVLKAKAILERALAKRPPEHAPEDQEPDDQL